MNSGTFLTHASSSSISLQLLSFWQKIPLRVPSRNISGRVTSSPNIRFCSHTLSTVEELCISHLPSYSPYKCCAASQAVVTRENMSTFTGKTVDSFGNPRLTVVGHRGLGMNTLNQSQSQRQSQSQSESQREVESQLEEGSGKVSILENTILSLNAAAAAGADFVEFDVQVTKDGHSVLFHDDLILTDDGAARKIEDITLEEFLAIGPQKDCKKPSLSLLRRGLDGSPRDWSVDLSSPLSSLADAFFGVECHVGFNVEVKFAEDDVSRHHVSRALDSILATVENFNNGRKLYFSSFNPDAVLELKKRQTKYPVFFLTEGGASLYKDERKNSIENAIKLCQEYRLDGIVSEVKTILENPSQVQKVKEKKLILYTYGDMNNNLDSVRLQNCFGVDGVIVDNVSETVSLKKENK